MSEKNKKKYYEIKNEIYGILATTELFALYLGKADVYTIQNQKKIYIKRDILIALKEIQNFSYEESLEDISNEISILSKLNNNNIVKMIDIIEIKGKNYIAFEYCNGGNLREYMNYFQDFNESFVQIILMQVVNGLIDLFEKNVVHHDIKPENILLHFYDVPEKYIKSIKGILTSSENNNLLFNLINNNKNGFNNQFYQFQNHTLQNNNNNNIIFNINIKTINNMSKSIINLNESIKNLSIVDNNFKGINKNNNYKMSNVHNNMNINMNNMNINIMNNHNTITNNINYHFITHRMEERGIMTKKFFLDILKTSTEYKISNFIFATFKSDIRKRKIRGTPLYMAPELLNIDSKLSEIENKKVDIWAVGVLAYELFFGKRPFEGYSLEEISEMYDIGTYKINLRFNKGKNKEISKEFFHFLNKCLQKNPKKRANIYELLNSDFLNYDNETSEKMSEKELKKYLEGIVNVDFHGNFILNIYKDYEEEIKSREINNIWINNN